MSNIECIIQHKQSFVKYLVFRVTIVSTEGGLAVLVESVQ